MEKNTMNERTITSLLQVLKTSQSLLMTARQQAWTHYEIGCEFDSAWRADYVPALDWLQEELYKYPTNYNASMI
jgi:hypothetical protein